MLDILTSQLEALQATPMPKTAAGRAQKAAMMATLRKSIAALR